MEEHEIEEKTTRLAEVEKVLAQKTAIAERLIAEQDAIIEQELRRHEEAAFYIRLQSSCFNLYPLLVRILLGMIDDPHRRTVFRSVINGKNIHRVAARLAVTPEEIGTTFCATVRSLSNRVGEMFALFAGYRKTREQSKAFRIKYLEADAERQRLFLSENFLRWRVDMLEQECSEKEEQAKLLRDKLKQEKEERWRLEREISRLQVRMDELAYVPQGRCKIFSRFALFVKKIYIFACTP